MSENSTSTIQDDVFKDTAKLVEDIREVLPLLKNIVRETKELENTAKPLGMLPSGTRLDRGEFYTELSELRESALDAHHKLGKSLSGAANPLSDFHAPSDGFEKQAEVLQAIVAMHDKAERLGLGTSLAGQDATSPFNSVEDAVAASKAALHKIETTAPLGTHSGYRGSAGLGR